MIAIPSGIRCFGDNVRYCAPFVRDRGLVVFSDRITMFVCQLRTEC